MAHIMHPQRWRRPPRGRFEIDWTHPITRGMFMAFGHDGGGAFREMVRDSQCVQHSNPTIALLNSGNLAGDSCAAKLTSAAANFYTLPSNSSYNVVADISLFWSGALRVGSQFHSFVGKAAGNGGTNSPFEFRTGNQASPVLAFIRSSASATTNWPSLSTLSIGAYHQVVVTAPDPSTGSTSASYYVDTVFELSASRAAITPTSDTSDIYIGRRPDNAVQLDGWTELVMGWNRQLSSVEAKTLWETPWRLFKSRPVITYSLMVPSIQIKTAAGLAEGSVKSYAGLAKANIRKVQGLIP